MATSTKATDAYGADPYSAGPVNDNLQHIVRPVLTSAKENNGLRYHYETYFKVINPTVTGPVGSPIDPAVIFKVDLVTESAYSYKAGFGLFAKTIKVPAGTHIEAGTFHTSASDLKDTEVTKYVHFDTEKKAYREIFDEVRPKYECSISKSISFIY